MVSLLGAMRRHVSGRSDSVNLLGDAQYRGAGLNLQSVNRPGFVDVDSTVGTGTDINSKTQIHWLGRA